MYFRGKKEKDIEMLIDEGVEKRFWPKVYKGEKDDCWIWTASRSNKRYGQIRISGEMKKAHRVSFAIKYGEIPKGMCVLHHCDNGLCVNPRHLFLGTQLDNMVDCVEKNRQTRMRGEENGNSVLSDNDVLDIKRMCVRGHREYGMSALGRKYNVAPQTIWSIFHNKGWGHIND